MAERYSARRYAVLFFTIIAYSNADMMLPGDPVPSFEVETLGGTFAVDPAAGVGVPLVVAVVSWEHPAVAAMWADAESLRGFLAKMPASVECLVVPDSDTPLDDARRLRRLLLDAAAGRPDLLFAAARVRFATQSPAQLSSQAPEGGQGWPGDALPGLPADLGLLHVRQPGGEWEARIPRLDASHSWTPWPMPSGGALPLVAVNAADLPPCGAGPGGGGESGAEEGRRRPLSGRRLDGRIALLEAAPLAGPPPSGGCSTGQRIAAVAAAGAQAAVLYPAEGEPLVLRCASDGECSMDISIPAAMIARGAALDLAQRAARGGAAHGEPPLTAQAMSEQVPGHFVAVDHAGKLAEVGWEMIPLLTHIAWGAQWLDYAQRLQARLDAPAASVVRVLDGTRVFDGGPHGVRAHVTLPPREQLQRFARLELDFGLACGGPRDGDCPQWDHVIQAFVCCDDPGDALPPCDACPATAWAPAPGRLGEAGGAAAQRGALWVPQGGLSDDGSGGGKGEPPCGRELGRWVTPFRRRAGRWLTDATPLLPLFSAASGGGTCAITVQAAPWAGPWRPSLSLRFFSSAPSSSPNRLPQASNVSNAQQQQQQQLVPRLVVPLPFSGGTFDARYNERHAVPAAFAAPAWARRMALAAVITGHGSDGDNCAEFCPTSHVFLVNGREHAVAFSDAGSLWGCADRVPQGVQPNEHGTWAYGRGGWCDGQQVDPWVADVTADLRAPGVDNSVAYRGLYLGKDPAPEGDPGYIMMQAWLVVYSDPLPPPPPQAEAGVDGAKGGGSAAAS